MPVSRFWTGASTGSRPRTSSRSRNSGDPPDRLRLGRSGRGRTNGTIIETVLLLLLPPLLQQQQRLKERRRQREWRWKRRRKRDSPNQHLRMTMQDTTLQKQKRKKRKKGNREPRGLWSGPDPR